MSSIRYKLACACSKDSNQSVHKSLSFPPKGRLDPWLPIESLSKMCRLIWVFDGDASSYCCSSFESFSWDLCAYHKGEQQRLHICAERAQWLSGRVLDLRPRGHGFEPYRRHCVVSLSKNINPSLVLVQPRKTRPYITDCWLDVKNQIKQTKTFVQSSLRLHCSLTQNMRVWWWFRPKLVWDSLETLCFVLEQGTLSTAYYSTGSTQEDRKSSQLDWIIVDWDVKHQHKQTKPRALNHMKYSLLHIRHPHWSFDYRKISVKWPLS